MYDINFLPNPKKLNFREVYSTNPIKAKNPKELRKKIQASKEDIVVVLGGNDAINKAALSNKKTNILLDPDLTRGKDFMHHKNSGLTVENINLAKKNNIFIGFSFQRLLNCQDLHKTLSRMSQNVKICRKYKVNIILANFAYLEKERKNSHVLRSLGHIINMSTDEIKDSLNNLKKLEIRKKKQVSNAVFKI